MERHVAVKAITEKIELPVIVAPMFRVSTPELVIEACRNGVIGSFPSQNCRTLADLDDWLRKISETLKSSPIPYAINLVMRSERLMQDLELVVRYRTPIVISSVGSPEPIIAPVHAYGGRVLADVATLKHAKKALELGVDGLILLCSGAGGNGGWNNPFAFVRAVREFYDGLIVIAGSITDGRSIRAAEVLGADLAYMGTRFIATRESDASDEYKQMLLKSTLDDVITTAAFSGMKANFLRQSIIRAGLNPEDLPDYETFQSSSHRKKRWKTIWSAGQGVTSIKKIETVRQVIERLKTEYAEHSSEDGR